MAVKPGLTARVSGARCRGAARLRSGASRGARDGREAKAAPEAVPAGVQKIITSVQVGRHQSMVVACGECEVCNWNWPLSLNIQPSKSSS